MRKVAIRVRGQVQGVGFRPFVWQLAREYGLRGRVWNDAEGVGIEAGGAAVDAFVAVIAERAPPLARVDAVEVASFDGDLPDGFVIEESRTQGAGTAVTPDAATCPACLDEIRGEGRRRGHAFANCTDCGPRFTILRGMPWDRAQTVMADFAMCDACHAEYDDPGDRRFHAQPIACPECGPHLWLETGGVTVAGDPVAEAVARLRVGEIVAVKGLGGFHLACDAGNGAAVAQLRARKRRSTQPLAIMGSEAALEVVAVLGAAERALLRDPAAPIVIVPSRGVLPEEIGPGLATLGVMLPATPLHHLLVDAFGGVIVMTSGNLSGEPMVVGNDEARAKLTAFADAFLMHDRDIARRLDDSVERADPPMVLRRGRGRVPGTIPLPPGFDDAPRVLALGGQMKGAIALVKGGQALLGHHLGDLDDVLCVAEFERAVADYSALFDHRAEVVAVDAHPDYRATRAGQAVGLPVVEVFHHHAHLASCLAENGWPLEGGPVAGVVLDGAGLGPDGTIWGGEVLLGDYRGVERRGWLRPAPLPGGDRAAREPWRNAMARLDMAGMGEWADALFPDAPRDPLRQAMARMGGPVSSSAGRLFDAVAAVLGLCPAAQGYEGEAAMRLEAMAAGGGALPFAVTGGEVDPAPIWPLLRDGVARGEGAALAHAFHAGLAVAFAGIARDLVRRGEARAVALSGGCFQNALLTRLMCRELRDVPVLLHRRVPANDGGLALGQAVVAAVTTRRDGSGLSPH